MKRLVLGLAAIMLVLTACADRRAVSLGPAPDADASPDAGASPSPKGKSKGDASEPQPDDRSFTYELWFASPEGKLLPAYRTEAFEPSVGRVALTSLLDGPSEAEVSAGLQTAILSDAELLGLNIDDGLATVDLSSEFDAGGGSLEETLRLAQVVYTITQFETVSGVRFRLDGEPVDWFGGHGIDVRRPQTRQSYEDYLAPIVVESPAIGDRVKSPVTVSGTANVFEATVSMRILDADGDVIARTFTTATCGTGCRGDYAASVRFQVSREQPGVIEVFESSAEDGHPIHVVRIPVTLSP